MIAVAAGVVCREGRIMICQRKPGGHQPLKWEFPGGKLEAGESPEQALARELREAGVEIGHFKTFFAQDVVPDLHHVAVCHRMLPPLVRRLS